MSALPIDYLNILNTLDENERLEAKRGSEIGPSVLETICAFANEPGLQGGTLLLGIVLAQLPQRALIVKK